MELTWKEKEEIVRMVDGMESITEKWERKMCIRALAQAKLWGKKVDESNKRNGYVERLKKRYNR